MRYDGLQERMSYRFRQCSGTRATMGHHADHRHRDRPSLHPRQAGPVARAALARHRGRRAGHARDGVPATRPAADHRAQPRHQAAQPRARLHAWHVGGCWPTGSASSSTGAAGWPSGRWTNCRTGAWSCAASASSNSRMRGIGRDHADAIVEMRAILRERGVVSNRDFAMASRTRTQSYRGRKDSALALVLSVAHRRSDDAPPRALRARVRADRNGRARASHPRERRG